MNNFEIKTDGDDMLSIEDLFKEMFGEEQNETKSNTIDKSNRQSTKSNLNTLGELAIAISDKIVSEYQDDEDEEMQFIINKIKEHSQALKKQLGYQEQKPYLTLNGHNVGEIGSSFKPLVVDKYGNELHVGDYVYLSTLHGGFTRGILIKDHSGVCLVTKDSSKPLRLQNEPLYGFILEDSYKNLKEHIKDHYLYSGYTHKTYLEVVGEPND